MAAHAAGRAMAARPRRAQVWELDRKLLQAHALPLVVKYGTMSTSVEALNMDEFLPDAVANVVQTPEERLIMKQRPTRRALRR